MLPVTCPAIFHPKIFWWHLHKSPKIMIALAENEKALLWLAAYRADCKPHPMALRERVVAFAEEGHSHGATAARFKDSLFL
jgi:hypothetical protein